ncbi:MAG: hypothetical protein SOW01_05925 [Mediterranea sp.]|nr:hypothetical protein [Mediterranea sp.]
MPPELWPRSAYSISLPNDAPSRPDEQLEWNFKARSRVSCRS